jgi:hypothetical protein
MADEDPVAEGTRGLVRGAVVACVALVVLFAVLFAGSRLIGSKDHSASSDVHTRQLT